METNPAPSQFITLPVLFFAQQCPAAAHAQSATPQLSLSASTTAIVDWRLEEDWRLLFELGMVGLSFAEKRD
ncbi:hypothetical protein M0R45_015072 [Rubus argutus]|uniref:Uncharacterized protein n=1 Tax=Rubus argutus TaxID=59490 RepID=A0AAW1XQW8_RUBAR